MKGEIMDEKQLDKTLTLVGCVDNNAFELLYKQTAKGIYAFLYSYYKKVLCLSRMALPFIYP